MTAKLQDPNKPAHAIVDVRGDGSAFRNDGMELQAANSNPWYVLATVFGEQAEDAAPWNYDADLAAKNRRAWNGWVCAGLTEAERVDRAEKTGLKMDDLKPLTKTELDKITKLFKKRMGAKAKLPDATEAADFSKIWFSKFLCFESHIFEKGASFRSAAFNSSTSFRKVRFSASAGFSEATFSAEAYFREAMFSAYASFRAVMFSADADFVQTTFSSSADFAQTTFNADAEFSSVMFNSSTSFRSAMFNSSADFKEVRFSASADFVQTTFSTDVDFTQTTFSASASFRKATFSSSADFKEAMFSASADFRSTRFKSITNFERVRFLTAVPEFFGAEMFADTTFTLPLNYRENWPLESGKVDSKTGRLAIKGSDNAISVMPAKEQKTAYNRLRLFMNDALKIEEEQFFHRQEMRCKKEIEGRAHRVIYTLFEAVSDYGNSILRPIEWLFYLWIWGAVAMVRPVGGGSMWPDYQSIPHALGWSLSNLFTVFGFWRLYIDEHKGLHEILQIIGGVQTVCGFALLFLLGLGLRNRFRLH